MNIIVCVKQVPDPETPASAFRVDEAAKKVIPAPGIAPVISQFDAIAVEAALRIKDALGTGKITVISMGPQSARDVIKQGLAMGADEGVLLMDPLFENLDHYGIALVLSEAIKKVGEYDLILTGRQATDWDMGVTGPAIAELLDIPSVTIAKEVRPANGKVQVVRVLGDAFETVEAELPAVVTVSNELGEPRYPKLQQIMQAARKQVQVWSAADLGLDAGKLQPRLNLERLYIPVVESQVEWIAGDTPQEIAENLARKLREARIL